MNPRASQQRLGKYELRERLGHGGMAEVWKAFDTQLHRYVAIKLLHADLRTDPEFMTRFSREARFVASLHHPNIVQIYDFQAGGHEASSLPSAEINAPIAYMVMDYVEGETLAQYIHRTSRVGKFPSPTEILHIFASISKAIDYAHQEGMIHRDIKPANILLDKRHVTNNSIGEPVLTDFGIAKIVGVSSGTMSGMWSGTPLYVSPEQAQGYPATKRSDIYSLGVILYEICTGICPFRSESAAAIMMQQISATPTPPALINPAIPPALAATILCAIAKDPAERFSSASALTAAIAEAFHLPLPTGLLLPADPANALVEPTYISSARQDASPYRTVLGSSQSRPMGPAIQPSPTPSIPDRTVLGPPQSQPMAPIIQSSPTPSTPTPRSRRIRKMPLIAWFAILLVLVGSVVGTLYALRPGQASPNPTGGTLTFIDSAQYNANMTLGSSDVAILSLHDLPMLDARMVYVGWLMPDKVNDEAGPLLLGKLSVNGGKGTFPYSSPDHTNLLEKYSGICITKQPTNDTPNPPSLDLKTCLWSGWLPDTPTPGDVHQYSLLSHLRHLLAVDPMLQQNGISGGLATWMARNVGKVEEWSSAAQGSWADGDTDLVHKHLIRILDYLDGQTYVGLDVQEDPNWLVDLPGGKIGLLSYNQNQNQEPPGYLQHVDTHLRGIIVSPGHTDEQVRVATQADSLIRKMIEYMQQVYKDALQLVKFTDAQLHQPGTLALLNEMARLAKVVEGGGRDTTTGEYIEGVTWLSAQIQQLATISLQVSGQQ